MEGFDEEAYNKYFGLKESVKSDISTLPVDPANDYTYEQFNPKQALKTYTTDDIPISDRLRFVSENNIDNIDQLGELLRKILNSAWGTDWGEMSPDLKQDESAEKPNLPQITYDTHMREVAEKTSIKPVLTDTIIEVVDGQKTGDAFNVYRQWFDTIVEFDFWGRNSLEARALMTKFETLIGAYSGYLKRQGISEIFFLKEISPKLSTKFVEGLNMRCLMYYVRLERIQTVRISILKKIDLELNGDQTLQFTTGNNDPDNINATNNGITYKL